MARRQKIKKSRRINDIMTLDAVMTHNGSRVQKIEILQKLGYKISRKADSGRVEKKIHDAAFDAGEYLEKFDKQRNASNRRKRNRQKRK